MDALIVLFSVILIGQFHTLNAKPITNDDKIIDEIRLLLKDIIGEEQHHQQQERRQQHRQQQEERQQQRQMQSTCDIYFNALIYTVDTTYAWVNEPANAMVVENKKISHISYNNDSPESLANDHCYAARTDWNYIDLHGYTVLPGIHDVHTHPLEAESEVGGTCRFNSGFNPDAPEVIAYLRKCSKDQVGTDWILGHGHSIYDLLDHVENGGIPPVEILDTALPDVPVVILEETSHSAWVNTKALNKYTEDIKDHTVIGGIILDGYYKGIVLENAAMEIMAMALSPNISSDMRQLNYEGLLRALDVLRQNGITSVCDARSFWHIQHPQAWKQVEKEGHLTVRAILDLWAYPNLPDTLQIPKLKELYENNADSLLRMSQIKVYSDGIVPTTTAAMLDEYLHPLEVQGLGKTGMNYFDERRMAKYISELQSFNGHRGFDFHIHAIGDRGIREALNAIEYDWDIEGRHRITHLEIVHPNDTHRFHSLGVIADFQVAGDFTLPDLIGEIAYQVGKKADNSFPVKSVYDTGAKVTLSSDWDVSPVNPFRGIQHALQRGDQSVDIKAAVEMYTINAAYVMRQEDKVGSLVVGKEADFIVIDQNIFKIEPQYIKDTKVMKTILQGKEIYTAL